MMMMMDKQNTVFPRENHGNATMIVDDDGSAAVEGYEMLNRNARKPKRANHGKRPNCNYGRRKKRSRYGNYRR
eukprot:CAMPEP_0118701872 /NCGR_PEP_ID=MMETSP0800-20121206/17524_1 /TAXON_ID=210618 ORGANISM="Striatella unipunctata, Strain CCMP2910" /NCGR_SAMPLE_ID=MMETSP0800 /ASSEMBLY_ACC=CAM_ASM_000638 /LENGTH=72 /DNA_ID=CAMNT_0006602905 /DNA_START=343 /DNA_END=561 /DNA_ORIENTATION=+